MTSVEQMAAAKRPMKSVIAWKAKTGKNREELRVCGGIKHRNSDILVPTLRVGMSLPPLRGDSRDAERPKRHYDAEQRNEGPITSFPRSAWERLFHRSAVIQGTRSVRRDITTRSVVTRFRNRKKTEKN